MEQEEPIEIGALADADAIDRKERDLERHTVRDEQPEGSARVGDEAHVRIEQREARPDPQTGLHGTHDDLAVRDGAACGNRGTWHRRWGLDHG